MERNASLEWTVLKELSSWVVYQRCVFMITSTKLCWLREPTQGDLGEMEEVMPTQRSGVISGEQQMSVDSTIGFVLNGGERDPPKSRKP